MHLLLVASFAVLAFWAFCICCVFSTYPHDFPPPRPHHVSLFNDDALDVLPRLSGWR